MYEWIPGMVLISLKSAGINFILLKFNLNSNLLKNKLTYMDL